MLIRQSGVDARSLLRPTRPRADSRVSRLASSNRSATPRVSMSAFAISAAAPAVAPAKARVARTGIKARRARPPLGPRRGHRGGLRRHRRVRFRGACLASHRQSPRRLDPRRSPSHRASIDHRDRRSSGVVACRAAPPKHASSRARVERTVDGTLETRLVRVSAPSRATSRPRVIVPTSRISRRAPRERRRNAR